MSKLSLESLNRTIQTIGVLLERSRIKYFACFGTLLGLVRDKGIVSGDSDIDLGVYYEEVDERTLMTIFTRYQYKLTKCIRNDRNKKLLYASFEHKELPCVDVFCWIEYDGIRYHTYDTMNQRKEIPTEYVFKGIEADKLTGIFRTKFGSKGKYVLDRDIPVPPYGPCLGVWYPDYATKRANFGTSWTRHEVRMKTCKKWKDKEYVKKCHRASNERYENDLSRIVNIVK